MKLNSLILATVAASTIGFAMPAAAASALTSSPTAFTFTNSSPFTLLLDIVPTTSNKFSFQAKGAKATLAALSFSLSGSGLASSVAGSSLISGANRLAGFSDASNTSVQLDAGKHYTLALTGSIAPTASGNKGDLSLSWANATVTPVPEPETYAMMLGGLGLLSLLARRKKNTQATA